MNRRFRLALVTVGLCALAACVLNLSFDMDKTLVVQSQAGVTTIAQSQQVALSDYPDFVAHKDNVQSLDLDSADITVTAIDPTNKATVVNGTVVLQQAATPNAANDVQVGTLTNFGITVGAKVHLPGSPALDAFLMKQVSSAGTFYVVVTGTVDQAPVNITLDVNLHASLGYNTGIL
jgi:hypothetical protein